MSTSLARDVMTRNVVVLHSDVSVEEAIHTLIDNAISGVPVVDDVDRLVGLVTEFQLLCVAHNPSLTRLPVSEFMIREVVSISEETSLVEATDLMIAQRIRRVPVVDGERLVGLVSRRDILRHSVRVDLDEGFREMLMSLAPRSKRIAALL